MAYPQWWYRSTGRTRLIHSAAEQAALIGTWATSPAAFGVVTAPSVAQTALLAVATKAVLATTEQPHLAPALVATAVSLKADGRAATDARPTAFLTQTITRGRH